MHVKVCVSHPRQPSNDAACPRHQRVTLPFHQGSDDICPPPPPPPTGQLSGEKLR